MRWYTLLFLVVIGIALIVIGYEYGANNFGRPMVDSSGNSVITPAGYIVPVIIGFCIIFISALYFIFDVLSSTQPTPSVPIQSSQFGKNRKRRY